MKTMQSVLLYGVAAVLLGGASIAAYKRCRPLPQAQGAEIKRLQDLIDSTKVLVLSKTYCPYCIRTKSLLTELNVQFTAVELDQLSNGDDVQSAALAITGQRTVPNVFIGGKHIGGNDKTQDLHRRGQLVPLLKAAGAL